MKFTEYEYKRPNFVQFKQEFEVLLDDLKSSNHIEKQISVINKMNSMRETTETMRMLCKIRYELNTNNSFYKEEMEYFNETQPKIEELIFKYYKILLHTENKSELKKLFGEQLFNLAELRQLSFTPEIINDLQKENVLISEYISLLSKTKLTFMGQEMTLSEIRPFFQSKDRKTRKQAYEAYTDCYKALENRIDEIFNQMIIVRTDMARKLGYETFTKPAYTRLKRSGYTPEDIASFRDHVVKYVVPISVELLKNQEKRIGIDKLRYYDESFLFKTGNALPAINIDDMIETAFKMYSSISSETAEFFQFMKESELFDVTSRYGKIGGGYCDYFNDFKAPFIFGNLNGTAADVKTFTHEGGHAFQLYCARDFTIPEYHFTTLDTCEIHAVSMEFITYPYMEMFFKHDALKYQFTHLTEAILFIPYCCLIDEFQFVIYENPSLSIDQRKSKWRELEKKYLPYRDYEDNDFLNKGTYWYRQGHLFFEPFYYIDYAIAQICAFQFYKKFQENEEKAWNDYLILCKAGGSKSMLELIKLANLENPFNEATISNSVRMIQKEIDTIDDSDW